RTSGAMSSLAFMFRCESLRMVADVCSGECFCSAVVSLVDLFSGYDQCTLDPASRDITAFHTPLGLMRMTTLPMGYTNAVQVFDRVMRKVLHEQILQGRCEPFIDDVAAKPPSRSTYSD